jgi:hypothetical protein
MAAVQQALWNIFTHYSLVGNPRDPEYLKSQQLRKFCEDVQLFGKRRFTKQDLDVIFVRCVESKGPSSAKNGGKLSFTEFLSCLMLVSIKVYPNEESSNQSFQRLLSANVFPLASRRNPESIEEYLDDPFVRHLQQTFATGLGKMFSFYSLFCSKRLLTLSSRVEDRGNSMKGLAFGYPEFLRFASDFKLTKRISTANLLSTLELGDVYLSCVKVQIPTPPSSPHPRPTTHHHAPRNRNRLAPWSSP